jgi:peroxiredoxin (alkyl hydroperoxide reductase subunit C)
MFQRSAAAVVAAICSFTLAAAPALADLKSGTAAPPFTAQASLGGSDFTFDLQSALKKGPVVLYFYPAAFTSGCTKEAHEFADHIADYQKLNATVIGVSEDDIATLNKFSVSECRSKFAVAADADGKIAQAYDAVLTTSPKMYANRTSYVIATDGKIYYSYTALDPSGHVQNTLDALQRLANK